MLSKTSIHLAFEYPVWRMEIDETAELLFVELRDTEHKQVSFSGVDLLSGQLLFDNLLMPERWLTGIEAADQGVLLLHGFQSEKLPVHKGLTALSGRTGNVLWTNYNLNFEHKSANGPVVLDTRFQPRKKLIVDPETGQPADYEANAMDEQRSAIMTPQLSSADQIPAQLLPQQPYANAVHYLAYNNFRIVSLHSLQAVRLSQFLYVFNSRDELIFEDIISDDIQKMQPEAFIGYKNRLIWLKNRSEVKVLDLK